MNRLAAMEAFIRVVDTGSFSAAGRLLGVGQPAVSKAISQLEKRLDVQLLSRTTHGLIPTEAGQNFYDNARKAIEAADEAELAARGATAALSGRLRIGAAVTFARLHVMPKLADFLRTHPALNVEVVLDDRNVDLIETGLDLALRMGSSLSDSSLTARKIGESKRLVVATPEYLSQRGEPRSPGDLSKHDAVIYDVRGGGADWVFASSEASVSVTLNSRVRTSAAEGVREAVFAGIGLTVASEWMFAPELKSGKVKAILCDWGLPPVNLWCVFPSGRRISAKTRAFAKFIEQTLLDDAVLALKSAESASSESPVK